MRIKASRQAATMLPSEEYQECWQTFRLIVHSMFPYASLWCNMVCKLTAVKNLGILPFEIYTLAVLQAKRDRSVRATKPPVGPKRSAVGPPPARAVSTDVDEDMEDHSGVEAEIGPWGDTYIDDREAKKQLRKEKNRASAAASRARREAYTASLEEEVSTHRLVSILTARQINV